MQKNASFNIKRNLSLKVANSSINSMEYESLMESCQFSLENQKMIEDVHFLVRRNLEKYPFTVGMTLTDRVKLMREVQFVTRNFDQELKGTFYRYYNLSQKN